MFKSVLPFETLYTAKSAYVYSLCFHLEADVEQAERLFTELWRAVLEIPPEVLAADGVLDEDLCRLLAEFFLKMGGGQSRLGTGGDEFSSLLTLLTGEYRLPLVFKEIGGLDYAGLSVALGVPEPTIRSRLARARASFRKVQNACLP